MNKEEVVQLNKLKKKNRPIFYYSDGCHVDLF